jgi:hypothetical protein
MTHAIGLQFTGISEGRNVAIFSVNEVRQERNKQRGCALGLLSDSECDPCTLHEVTSHKKILL